MPEPIIIKIKKEYETPASFSAKPPLEDIVYGRFGVSDIRQCETGYEFIDLELPIGTYSSLVLKKDFLDGGRKKSLSGWKKWNATSERDVVMPAWLRYALMVVCNQKNSEPSLKAVVKEIRTTIWIPDAHEHNPSDATHIAYRSGLPAIVTHGVGLPETHPLYNQISDKSVAGPDTYVNHSSKPIIPALEATLYDNDPARVKDVLVWAMKPPRKTCYLYRLGKTETDNRVVVFGVGNVDVDVADISAYDGADSTRAARGVAADAKNFQRM